jgi:hypothetical protein
MVFNSTDSKGKLKISIVLAEHGDTCLKSLLLRRSKQEDCKFKVRPGKVMETLSQKQNKSNRVGSIA